MGGALLALGIVGLAAFGRSAASDAPPRAESLTPAGVASGSAGAPSGTLMRIPEIRPEGTARPGAKGTTPEQRELMRKRLEELRKQRPQPQAPARPDGP